MERAGRGADLLLVRRDVSRHASAEAGAAGCGIGVDPVDPAGLLANSVSRAVVGYDPGGVGEEQSRSVFGGLADPAGVGVRSVGDFVCERLRTDAIAAVGGQERWRTKKESTHFQTFQLLDPETNIRLGTRYLRQMLDQFGGVQEYALAAYNAGDNRVVDWQAAGPYSGMDEFVESIPFTQTREYVEAILRNEETYRAIDEYARSRGAWRIRLRGESLARVPGPQVLGTGGTRKSLLITETSKKRFAGLARRRRVVLWWEAGESHLLLSDSIRIDTLVRTRTLSAWPEEVYSG